MKEYAVQIKREGLVRLTDVPVLFQRAHLGPLFNKIWLMLGVRR